MFGATILSTALHAAAIAAAVVVWPYVAPPAELPPDIVPVDLLTVADTTNIAPQEKTEDPPPVPEQLAMPDMQVPPPVFEEPPPPPPEDEAPALEPLEEKKEPPPEPPKPQPPQPRYALATPRVKPKPDKPKEEFDPSKILMNLEKMEKQTAKADSKAAPPKAERAFKAAGAQSALTVSEIDALRAKMSKCWNVLAVGAPDPSALVLRVRVFLNHDGTIASQPQLIDQGRPGDPYFRAAADAAIRAVVICGPYELPPDKYEYWKEIEITFDPREMAGY